MQGSVVSWLFIIGGITLIFTASGMAIRTFMIPSGAPPLINRVIFRFTQAIFDVITRIMPSEQHRQHVLSLYAPVSLLAVLASILFTIGLGYTMTFFGLGITPFIRAFLFSASALSTMGFESPGSNFWVIMLSAIEALTVATIVALLIGYLPGIYSSYQQREQAVASLNNLTGQSPDGIKVIDAFIETFGVGKLGELWQTWIDWFGGLASARSTLSGELYLRSSRWDRSWISAAGAMLDAAAIADSSLDLTTDPAADRLVRTGTHTLTEVLEPLRLHCPDRPSWPSTPTNITQDEFNQAFDHFKQAGLPMKPDRDAAWRDFANLRVKYECSLMALIRLKNPPHGSRWTTDREETKVPLSLPVFGHRLLRRGSQNGTDDLTDWQL